MTVLPMLPVRQADRIGTRCPEISLAGSFVVPGFVAADWPGRLEQTDLWFRALMAAGGTPERLRDRAIWGRTVPTSFVESIPSPAVDSLEAALVVFLTVNTSWRLTANTYLRTTAEEEDYEELAADIPGIFAVLDATSGTVVSTVQ